MADDLPFDPSTVEVDDSEDAPKRTRRERSDKGVTRGPRGGTSSTGPRHAAPTKLATQLIDPIAKLSKAVALPMPTVAAVLAKRAESTATALVAVAQGHPKFLAALTKVSKVGPGSDLAETAFMVVIASQMDLGRIPPEHPLANLSGVAPIYIEMHQHMQPQPPTLNIPDGLNLSPPPGFYQADPNEFAINDPHHPMYSFQASA